MLLTTNHPGLAPRSGFNSEAEAKSAARTADWCGARDLTKGWKVRYLAAHWQLDDYQLKLLRSTPPFDTVGKDESLNIY
jgi:hypothetical protein